MTDLEAAVVLAQLDKADGYVARQVVAADRLRSTLADVPGLRVLGDDPRAEPNRLFLAVRFDPNVVGPAGLIARAVQAEGIPAIFPYDEPIYRHPLFAERRTYGSSGYPFRGAGRPEVDYTGVQCPVTEDVLATTAMVRMNQSWTDADLDDVAVALRKVAESFAMRRQVAAGR
jgi:dTDP-4-amino-4,6-dideoxygalactose transaminase